MPDRIGTLIDRAAHHFGKRGTFMSLCQEIAENFYPERAHFTRQAYIGEEFAYNLNSSYPLIVRRELGNAFSTMLRPRDEEWFAITIENDEKLDQAGRQCLEWMTNIQRRAMYDRVTQFVRATKEGDNDFAAFGQTCISRELDMREQALLYRCWHLKDVCWIERYNGTIGEVYRRWKPSVRDLCKLFPNGVHDNVRRALEQSPQQEIDCLHVVLPSEDYEGPDPRMKRYPWVSVHIDVANKTPMQEIGSWSRIYTIPRWQTVSGSQYAYSPATVAGLPDARLLQAMTLTLLEAGEMNVRPPLIAVKEAIRSDVAIFAGGITWADAEYDERLGEVLRPLYQDKTGFPIGIDMQKDAREMLAQAFYLNKLNLPTPTAQPMTAYEMSQRIQEYIRSALPLFEPMETEYNASLCEDTFECLLRTGAFGSPHDFPDSIQGAQIRFRFESPLHQAIERKKGQQFIESKQLIDQAVALDPISAQLIDTQVALRDALNGIGTPAKWLRTEDAVKQIADDQAAQQQAQSLLQNVQQTGAAAQSLGEAQKSLTQTT
jgi:hypothetical protein